MGDRWRYLVVIVSVAAAFAATLLGRTAPALILLAAAVGCVPSAWLRLAEDEGNGGVVAMAAVGLTLAILRSRGALEAIPGGVLVGGYIAAAVSALGLIRRYQIADHGRVG